jgi:hypothetical protein
MKRKVEADLKMNSVPAKKILSSQVIKEKIDETYLQVNQLSFQQNFKTLIGHYKSSDISLI